MKSGSDNTITPVDNTKNVSSLRTFTPPVLGLDMDVDRVPDVHEDLIPVSGHEPVQASVGGVQQLQPRGHGTGLHGWGYRWQGV